MTETDSKKFLLCLGGSYPRKPTTRDIYKWGDKRYEGVTFLIDGDGNSLETVAFTTEGAHPDPVIQVVPRNRHTPPTSLQLFHTDRTKVFHNPRVPDVKVGYIVHEARNDPSNSEFIVKPFGDDYPRTIKVTLRRRPRARCEWEAELSVRADRIESFTCPRGAADATRKVCAVSLGR